MVNQIEIKRSIWQIPFSGAAGALSWYSYKNAIIYPEYAKIKQFLSNMDGKGGWHPGAVERASDGRWVLREDWEDEMDRTSKKADLLYLRSDSKDYAIGVITNKTYNIKTAYDNPCQLLPPDEDYDHVREKEFINTRQEDLYLNGLNNGRYYITYFFPGYQSEPYLSDDQNGPRIRIKTILMQTDNFYITLFMARKTGNNWTPEQEDSITLVMNEKLQELAKTFNYKADSATTLAFEQNSAFKIYPNPTTDILTLKTDVYGENVLCKIMSSDSKEIKKLKVDTNELLLDISTLEKGIYHILILENNIQIHHQKIIKL